MDKKEINSTKLTLNFLVWIGGVFMLLLFALLAHFVGVFYVGSDRKVRVAPAAFCPYEQKSGPIAGATFPRGQCW